MSRSILWSCCRLVPAATKLGQGNVFTGVCDFVNRWGCLPQCMLGYMPPQEQTPPLGADTPLQQTPPSSRHPPRSRHPQSRHPPEQTPPSPQEQTPPADTPREQTLPPEQTPPREADSSSIRSTSGRHASYWNAFLSLLCFSNVNSMA